MLEPERAVAGDRRALLGDDEFALEQRVNERRDVLVRAEALERATPEDAADHGRALQRVLLLGREAVDPRGDQRLDRVRDALGHGAVLEHARDLLEEKRV